jgi:hypothetical protein
MLYYCYCYSAITTTGAALYHTNADPDLHFNPTSILMPIQIRVMFENWILFFTFSSVEDPRLSIIIAAYSNFKMADCCRVV